jgi:hypothetical protein
MICYEDIFPSFGRRLTKKHPNLLINITNDAWFGRTSEPYEHLALAVYRAVESRVDLVRAVNTGVSAFVDSTGRVNKKLDSVDPDETPSAPPAMLLDTVALTEPFTLYASLGEWFGALCLLIVSLLALVARARGGHPVRWPLVASSATCVLATTLVGVALLRGPSQIGAGLSLLAHRAVSDLSAQESFATGLALGPGLALGCLLAGFVVTRRVRGVATLEVGLGVLATLVIPSLVFGTLEGEQAGLVLTALAGIGLAAIGGRIARRLLARAAR